MSEMHIRYHIFIMTMMIISMVPVCAQKEPTGMDHYKKKEYALAVKSFEKEWKKAKGKRSEQARIEVHTGMSYYYMNKPVEASEWLKNGIDHGYKRADACFIYGLSLQKQERYTEALQTFNQCLATDSNYPNIQLHIQSCNYALAHPEANEQIVLHPSKVNTDGSEYGISPCADGEIFFSRARAGGRIDPRTGMAYTEVFVSKMDENDLSKPDKEKTFTKAYHNTGVFAYHAQTNLLYMTVCDPKGTCGIYKSRYNRNKWEKPEPFLVNSRYDMAHPAITEDGNRLYFSSNAPGGQGKTDIWHVDRLSEDKWSDPVNMGSSINTPGREEFPFADGDSLYFASDGHEGFGGLDIFMATIGTGETATVQNPGRPFNSGADDFNLTTVGGNCLLVSSRNTSSSDDIYIFDKSELKKITPTEKEEKNEPEEKPEEKPEPVIDEATESVAVAEVPKPKPAADTSVQPKEEKPEAVIDEVTESVAVAEAPKQKPVADTSVQPKTEDLMVIYFDFNRFVPQRKYRLRYEEIVSYMKARPNATFEVAGHADPRGGTEFNAELSDKRAEYIAKRLVDRGISREKLIIKGYGFSHPVAPDADTEEEFQLNRRVEIRMIKTSK